MAPPAKPNRYELPLTSMAGAMIVVLALVGAYVGFRALNRDNGSVTPQAVDYRSWVHAGHVEGRLRTLAPPHLPTGWRATSAVYDAGSDPHWHLGVLTADNQYIGIEEGLDPLSDQVAQFVDANASRGPDVRIAGAVWHTWTDARGDHALGRTMPALKGRFPDSIVVVGSAPAAELRAYVSSLR